MAEIDRHAHIQCAYQYVPEMGYLAPTAIPAAVSAAAIDIYARLT